PASACPAKRSPNDIVNRPPIIRLSLADDHGPAVSRGAREGQEWPQRPNSVVWTGRLPCPVLPQGADCLAARRTFAFRPNFSREPTLSPARAVVYERLVAWMAAVQKSRSDA